MRILIYLSVRLLLLLLRSLLLLSIELFPHLSLLLLVHAIMVPLARAVKGFSHLPHLQQEQNFVVIVGSVCVEDSHNVVSDLNKE